MAKVKNSYLVMDWMTLKGSECRVTRRIQVKARLLPLRFGRRISAFIKRPAEMNSVIPTLGGRGQDEGKTGAHKGRHLAPAQNRMCATRPAHRTPFGPWRLFLLLSSYRSILLIFLYLLF